MGRVRLFSGLEISLALTCMLISAAVPSPPCRYHFYHTKWPTVISPESAFESQRDKKGTHLVLIRKKSVSICIFLSGTSWSLKGTSHLWLESKTSQEVILEIQIPEGRGDAHHAWFPYVNHDCAVGGLDRDTSRWWISKGFSHTCSYDDAPKPWN